MVQALGAGALLLALVPHQYVSCIEHVSVDHTFLVPMCGICHPVAPLGLWPLPLSMAGSTLGLLCGEAPPCPHSVARPVQSVLGLVACPTSYSSLWPGCVVCTPCPLTSGQAGRQLPVLWRALAPGCGEEMWFLFFCPVPKSRVAALHSTVGQFAFCF